MKSSGPIQRRTQLRQRSTKKVKADRERAVFRARFLYAHPRCEWPTCIRVADDVHEVVTRARGGSIVDEHNCKAVCRFHHDYIHDNPTEATEAGFLARKET